MLSRGSIETGLSLPHGFEGRRLAVAMSATAYHSMSMIQTGLYAGHGVDGLEGRAEVACVAERLVSH